MKAKPKSKEVCHFFLDFSLHWGKKGEPFFMSTGWPPFRYIFSTTLQSGTICKEKNASTLQSGTVFHNRSKVEPFWLHFFPVFNNPIVILIPQVMEDELLKPIGDLSAPQFRCVYLPNVHYPTAEEKCVVGFVFSFNHGLIDGMSCVSTLRKFRLVWPPPYIQFPIQLVGSAKISMLKGTRGGGSSMVFGHICILFRLLENLSILQY